MSMAMDKKLYNAATTGINSDVDFDSFGFDFQQTTVDDMNNALHLASRFNQEKFAEETIKRHPELMHQKNHKGDTPLHIAARYGRSKIAELLANQQVADIEAPPPPPAEKSIFETVNDKGDTALHDAVQSGHLDVVKTLITNHPESKNVCNKVGDSSLFLAVDRKFVDIAKYIIHDSPECSYEGRGGMNVLHAAVIRTCRVSHSKDLLELWVHHSKIPTAVIYNVFKAIMFIWKRPLDFIERVWDFLKERLRKALGDEDKVKKLEKNVKHLTEPIREMFWLFVNCCCRKESDIKEEEFLESLIKKFQMLIKESEDELQWTPLHYAAHLRHTKAVKLLLESDITVVYKKDKEGMSALHIAAKQGNVEVMKQILDEFPETCGLLDNNCRTILHVAVENGKYNVVKYILQKDALEGLLNEQDRKDGNTPLHYAVIYGHWSILKVLVDDERVDRGILNNKGLVAHTLISDMELRYFQKSRISKKLDNKGGPPSLKAIVNRENSQTKDADTRKEQLENIVTNKDSDDLKNLSGGDVVPKAIVNRKSSQTKDVETRKGQLENIVTNKDSDDPKNSSGVPKEDVPKCRDIREVGSTHILVITIIASVTFAAGFQIPGGVDHGSSFSAASHKLKLIFAAFQIANTLSLCSALAAIATHFSAATEKECGAYKHLITFASSLTYISIWSTGVSYIMGSHLVLTKHPLLAAANLAIFGCSFFLTILVWFLR